MEILMLLIPLSVVLIALVGVAFWWSVRSGQFDDLEGPAHRILADDDRVDHGAVPRADDVEPPARGPPLALISVKPRPGAHR